MSKPAEGRVSALWLNKGSRKPLQPVDVAALIPGKGAAGDRHARADRQRRSVLVMDEETLSALELAPGDVREQITTAGIDIYSLRPGDRIAFGNQAVLQITMECEPCERMDELKDGLQEAIRGRRGMLAFVERGGRITVGDPVRIARSE
ncbi:MAG: MOSC domain-containing protein [SAR202 cluster bacterium]|nr:MOSC domain-containing protein [SAR202 cluster bacterium]